MSESGDKENKSGLSGEEMGVFDINMRITFS